jgi:hypothetical protein
MAGTALGSSGAGLRAGGARSSIAGASRCGDGGPVWGLQARDRARALGCRFGDGGEKGTDEDAGIVCGFGTASGRGIGIENGQRGIGFSFASSMRLWAGRGCRKGASILGER